MNKDRSKAKESRLSDLIEKATVDAYGEHEELAGLATMIEDFVVTPFDASVIGESVVVTGFKTEGISIKAVCHRGRRKYNVDLSSMEWLMPSPKGFEWIEAYLEWQRRF